MIWGHAHASVGMLTTESHMPTSEDVCEHGARFIGRSVIHH